LNAGQDRIPLISPRPEHREVLARQLVCLAEDLRLLNRQIVREPAIKLSDWYFSAMPVLTISGIAHGHPKLGTKPIATSQVFYINTDVGLVRTLNNWYRLGVPMESSPSSSEH
jgi:hypothetical protein